MPYVITYFFDGSTKFDTLDFETPEDAANWAEAEQSRMNAAGTEVSVVAHKKD